MKEKKGKLLDIPHEKVPVWVTVSAIALFFLVLLGPFFINSAADNIRAVRNLIAAIKGN